jgi:hypothetical protein
VVRRGGVAVALAALVLGAPGCRPGSAVTSGADAGPVSRPSLPPQIVLALPPAWTITAGADGVVRASSPRGQPVLRAEVERGVGLPTAATLRSGFLGGLRHLRPRSESITERRGFIAMRFVLGEPDAGPQDFEALLSATLLGDDTLLCSTLRGATREELDLALAACQSAVTDAGIR